METFKPREHPNHGVKFVGQAATVIYVTICTKHRVPWLADAAVHTLLRKVWSEADAWLVGRYVLMPDHIHLFAGCNSDTISLERWIKYWKADFSRRHGDTGHKWQTDHWDTRLRNNESYDNKWEYVRDNPVRRGLVKTRDEWPFQGELYLLEM